MIILNAIIFFPNHVEILHKIMQINPACMYILILLKAGDISGGFMQQYLFLACHWAASFSIQLLFRFIWTQIQTKKWTLVGQFGCLTILEKKKVMMDTLMCHIACFSLVGAHLSIESKSNTNHEVRHLHMHGYHGTCVSGL